MWHTMEISAFPGIVGEAKALEGIGVD